MEHAELVNLALGVHGSVFVGSLLAFYKYGDRTETTEKSLRGTTGLLEDIRNKIELSLTEHLRIVFERAESTPTVTLDNNSSTYIETLTNPTGSEAFREEIADFLADEVTTVADYVEVRKFKCNYCLWSRRLSWSIVFLIIWQALCCGSFLIIDIFGGYTLPDWSFLVLSSPTILLFVLAIIAIVFLMLEHDRIENQKNKHKRY